jgi:hypothetical protein
VRLAVSIGSRKGVWVKLSAAALAPAALLGAMLAANKDVASKGRTKAAG